MNIVIASILMAAQYFFAGENFAGISSNDIAQVDKGILSNADDSWWCNIRGANNWQVRTNIVLCMEITTEKDVAIPCPDGYEGCCVLHSERRIERKYVPVKHISDYVHYDGGLGFKQPILEEMAQVYKRIGLKSDIIPIRPWGSAFPCQQPIGWIIKSKLDLALEAANLMP